MTWLIEFLIEAAHYGALAVMLLPAALLYLTHERWQLPSRGKPMPPFWSEVWYRASDWAKQGCKALSYLW